MNQGLLDMNLVSHNRANHLVGQLLVEALESSTQPFPNKNMYIYILYIINKN